MVVVDPELPIEKVVDLVEKVRAQERAAKGDDGGRGELRGDSESHHHFLDVPIHVVDNLRELEAVELVLRRRLLAEALLLTAVVGAVLAGELARRRRGASRPSSFCSRRGPKNWTIHSPTRGAELAVFCAALFD